MDISSSAVTITTPVGLDSNVISVGDQYKITVSSAKSTTVGSYTFYLVASLPGPVQKWSTSTLTLSVLCGPSSTVVGLGSFPNSLTSYQYVDVND